MMQNPIGIFGFVIAILAAIQTASPLQPAATQDTSYLPSKFAVEIGGFRGPSYKVEMRDGKLYYKAENRAAKPEVVEKIITPTEEQWRSFWQEVEKAQLWQWSQKYFNSEVKDGTHWRVEIEHGSKTINVAGSNAYPLEGDVAKSNKSPASSLPFNQFLRTVRTLINNLPLQ